MTTLTTQLEQLENAQLVRRLPEEDPAYLFKHALTQESAYKSLLLKKRRDIHHLVAQAYEQQYPERLDEFAAILAQHYAEAGDDAKTFEYAKRAGDRATRVYANAEAEAHYKLALQSGKSIASPPQLQYLYLQRGRMLEYMGRYHQALENYQDMALIAQQFGDRALELAALIAHATIYSTPNERFNLREAQLAADRALALARDLGDRSAEAKIFWILMLSHIHGGNADQAVQHGEASLQIARELNLREQLAYTLNDLGGHGYLNIGKVQAAFAALEEARALWRELGNLPMLADNLTSTALNHYTAGHFDQALADAQDAYRLSSESDNLWGQGYSRSMQGFAYVPRDLGQAITAFEECAGLAKRSNFAAGEVAAKAELGWLYAYLGDSPRGLVFEKQAVAMARSNYTEWLSWSLACLARIWLRQGDLAKAESALQEAYDHFNHKDPNSFGIISVPLADAELSLLRHDPDRAIRVVDALLATIERYQIGSSEPEALYVKGRAWLMQNRIAKRLTRQSIDSLP